MMEKWMNHPAMKNLDPIKMELIRTAAKQTEGKTGKALAPVMLSLIVSANKRGIRFTPEETDLILSIMKEGKSSDEKAQIDHMVDAVKKTKEGSR